jgi:glycerate kinase
VADGGDGTARVLLQARGGAWRTAEARDPLGRPLTGGYAVLGDGRTAVVDVAEASGLALLAPGERDPLGATTAGTGDLIAAAVAGGAEEVIVAAGGSATVDGGEGALGVLRELPRLPRIVVACDVTTAWEDAAAVFGPQKGADPATVGRLQERLAALAATAPRDPRGVPATGAAGGLSGGLWAHLGAQLVPGAALVLDAVGFDAALRGADAVVTGEGRLDAQSLAGKAVGEVARRAAAAGVPCDAVVGRDALAGEDRGALALRTVVEATDAAAMGAAGARLAAG